MRELFSDENELTKFDFFFQQKKSATNTKEKKKTTNSKEKKQSQRDTSKEKKGCRVIQSGEPPSPIMIEPDYGVGEELVNINCIFCLSF